MSTPMELIDYIVIILGSGYVGHLVTAAYYRRKVRALTLVADSLAIIVATEINKPGSIAKGVAMIDTKTTTE
jgi:tRNA A37 threonylcarbamoyladenosine dehydratase